MVTTIETAPRDIKAPPVVTIKAGRGLGFDVDGMVLRAIREDPRDNTVLVQAEEPGCYLGWHPRKDLHFPGGAVR